MKQNLPEPPQVGEMVWICIPEHYYPWTKYPEFKNIKMKHAPAPALAQVIRLDFFEKGSKLKPTVVCASHLIGNPNNLHHVRWPNGNNVQLFRNRDDCIKRCEELADLEDAKWLNERFGYKCLRPWREREVIE